MINDKEYNRFQAKMDVDNDFYEERKEKAIDKGWNEKETTLEEFEDLFMNK